MGDISRVAILEPMTVELKPFLKKLDLTREPFHDRAVHRGRIGKVEVIATLTHIGMDEARRTTERVLDEFDVDHVIVSGVAGGIGTATHIGHLVVPDVVVDYHTQIEYRPTPLTEIDADRRGRLVVADDYIYDRGIIERFEADGIVAVDMETAAVAAVCTERGVGWSVYRGISDHVNDTHDDSIMKLVRSAGSPEPVALIKYLLRDPRRVRVLMQLAKGSAAATNAAANATIKAVTAVS
jgi:adenosylhomocysteine nucleosidase